MRNLKQYLCIGLAVMAGALLLVGPACGQGFRGHGGPGGPGLFSRLDKIVQSLNLDAAQQTAYQSLQAQLKTDREAARTARQNFVSALKTQLGEATPNWTAIGSLIQTQQQAMAQSRTNDLNLILQFCSTLTAQQQTTLCQQLLARLNRVHQPTR